MTTKEVRAMKRRRWLIKIMRVAVLVAGLYDLMFGETLFGVVILLSLLAISLPGLVTRGRIKAIPLEFEFILFVMVTLQFVIGETLNFYDNVPYFDLLVHFTLPLFLGYITALLAYTMYATGNLRMPVGAGVLIVVLVALGIGALWEIFEYLADHFAGTHLQGNLTSSALVDTMNDLIMDTLGGIFGALLALRYIKRGRQAEDSRLVQLTDEIVTDFAPRPKQKAAPEAPLILRDRRD